MCRWGCRENNMVCICGRTPVKFERFYNMAREQAHTLLTRLFLNIL